MSDGSLFDDLPPPPDTASPDDAPLADRMRPRDLDELEGQEEALGDGGFLRAAIEEDRVPSLIFWGPPGSGKTTLARIIARRTARRFIPFSAVTAGIREVRRVMQDAARLRRGSGRSSLLFVDEIHRFNRAQQDAFLPFVERGDIVLVGATTQNPSFEVNSALLSRCRVVVLRPLTPQELERIVERALADAERGLGGAGIEASAEAVAALADLAAGDARQALNLLELAARRATGRGERRIDRAAVERLARSRAVLYDKSGEEHYNLISALHKSIRESDPDAALYWLARMLAGGEDPRYLARRMLRVASEDVGLADPDALGRVLAAWQAWERLGSPEGELALAQAVVELALAPKSNAVYRALGEARQAAEEHPAEPVPLALRNAPTRLMKELGYGRGYRYAHDTEEGVAGLECLPEPLRGRAFYRPGASGAEKLLRRRLERLRQIRRRVRDDEPEP